jgi:hypothetical protein
MNFDPIDFGRYNKPPYLPQWLSRGETKKFTNYGDQQFVEIDGIFRDMSGQYDLGNIKGAILDRLGKLVNEKRDGKPDEIYRLMIRLRTLLNTTTGSVPELIKVIKFLYGSEIVHIVPDYPAGLIILHDGEGPDVNFNDILRQVVGAGIDYSTKELFYFTEELPSNETVSTMKAKTSMMDSMAYIFHNSVYRRNGHIRHRYTGVKDVLMVDIGLDIQERLFGRALHNGHFKRNGEITHNGFVNDVATELWSFNGFMGYTENVQFSEQTTITLSYGGQLSDFFDEAYYHYGKIKRNGAIQHTRSSIRDVIKLSLSMVGFQDQLFGRALHNGLFKRNGELTHGGFVQDVATEKLSIVIEKKLKDTIASSEDFSMMVGHKVEETLHHRIRRNGLIRHNGQYNRATGVVDVQKIVVAVSPLTDTLSSSENMSIGYRKHYKHNGRFRRNGAIKHDSNVLLQLEE